MSLLPLHRRVLLRLDPESRLVGSGILVAPDKKTIIWCRRCFRQMEALRESKCTPQPIFETTPKGASVYRGNDTSHDIDSVEMPIVVETARRGTVLASATPEFVTGDRVLIDFASGVIPDEDDDPESPYRLVASDAILARIEDEATSHSNGGRP